MMSSLGLLPPYSGETWCTISEDWGAACVYACMGYACNPVWLPVPFLPHETSCFVCMALLETL